MKDSNLCGDRSKPDSPNQIDISTVLQIEYAAEPLTLVAKIKEGMPFELIEKIAERYGYSSKDICSLIMIAPSTRYRRKKAGRLNQSESDSLVNLASVFVHAENVLEGRENAATWMKQPNFGLAEETPLNFLVTDFGMRCVCELLSQIEHGIAA